MHHHEVVLHALHHVAQPLQQRLVRAACQRRPLALCRALGAGCEGDLGGGARPLAGPLARLPLLLRDTQQQILRLTRPVVPFEVGHVSSRGLGHPVVFARWEECVVQIRHIRHRASLLGGAQQGVIPLPQPVRPGGLLLVGVAVQDVVITLQRGTGPDEHGGVAAGLDVRQVRQQQLVVHQRPQRTGGHARPRRRHRRLFRAEILHAVDVRQIHPPRVGCWAAVAVLLSVYAVQAHVHALDPLEQQDHLLSEGQAAGEAVGLEGLVEVRLDLLHLVHVIDHPHREGLRRRHRLHRQSLGRRSRLALLGNGFVEVLLKVLAEVAFGELHGLQHGLGAHADGLALPLHQPLPQARRALVRHVLVVAPLVEEAADLVDPALAVIALHPAFLHLLIILLLGELLLLDDGAVHLGEAALLGLRHAPMAPVPLHLVLPLSRLLPLRHLRGVVHLIALDALAAAGAVQAGRLEGEPVLGAGLAHAVVGELIG
mmetsp:Transcript_8064/g.23948  ORF Transcript_8064/g.23948 Transcript_8064/m.23948 type:complete len:485 (-) Transcript_8064:1904-3358(-)